MNRQALFACAFASALFVLLSSSASASSRMRSGVPLRNTRQSSRAVIKVAFNSKLHAKIVVDGQGRTLYMLNADSSGTPTCAQLDPVCPKVWPGPDQPGTSQGGTGHQRRPARHRQGTRRRSAGRLQQAPAVYFAGGHRQGSGRQEAGRRDGTELLQRMVRAHAEGQSDRKVSHRGPAPVSSHRYTPTGQPLGRKPTSARSGASMFRRHANRAASASAAGAVGAGTAWSVAADRVRDCSPRRSVGTGLSRWQSRSDLEPTSGQMLDCYWLQGSGTGCGSVDAGSATSAGRRRSGGRPRRRRFRSARARALGLPRCFLTVRESSLRATIS